MEFKRDGGAVSFNFHSNLSPERFQKPGQRLSLMKGHILLDDDGALIDNLSQKGSLDAVFCRKLNTERFLFFNGIVSDPHENNPTLLMVNNVCRRSASNQIWVCLLPPDPLFEKRFEIFSDTTYS